MQILRSGTVNISSLKLKELIEVMETTLLKIYFRNIRVFVARLIKEQRYRNLS